MGEGTRVELDVLDETFAVVRLTSDRPPPAWALDGETFAAVTRRGDELSIVCDQRHVPPGALAQRGWRALTVRGPLDFALTGILASLATPLADAGVPIFAVSTYGTDVVLVPAERLEAACAALAAAGHTVHG